MRNAAPFLGLLKEQSWHRRGLGCHEEQWCVGRGEDGWRESGTCTVSDSWDCICMLAVLWMPRQPCISSQASGLLLGWEAERDDLAFGGVFAVRCAKCPTGDVKSQGEMQAALEAFPSPELLFLTHIRHCLTERWCKFLQLLCSLTSQSLQRASLLLCQSLIVMGD